MSGKGIGRRFSSTTVALVIVCALVAPSVLAAPSGASGGDVAFRLDGFDAGSLRELWQVWNPTGLFGASVADARLTLGLPQGESHILWGRASLWTR